MLPVFAAGALRCADYALIFQRHVAAIAYYGALRPRFAPYAEMPLHTPLTPLMLSLMPDATLRCRIYTTCLMPLRRCLLCFSLFARHDALLRRRMLLRALSSARSACSARVHRTRRVARAIIFGAMLMLSDDAHAACRAPSYRFCLRFMRYDDR